MDLSLDEVKSTETPNYKQHTVSIKADKRIIAEIELYTYNDIPELTPERFENMVKLLIKSLQ